MTKGMGRMISNHKIQTALDEIKEISKIDLALYSEKGKQVAATFEPEGDMEEAVTSFAASMAESQMLSGCHFFKVMVEAMFPLAFACWIVFSDANVPMELSLIFIFPSAQDIL